MRLAIVYPHSLLDPVRPQLTDALAIVNYELARRLAERHEVVVYLRQGQGQPREQRHEGVLWRRIPEALDLLLFRFKVLDRLGVLPPRRPFRTSPLYYAVFARRVARDMAARGIELAHVQNGAGFLPLFRRHLPRATLVLHQHDHALSDFDPALLLPRLRHAALILGCSGFVTDRIRRTYPELAARCAVLHNGVDDRFLALPTAPERSQRVLFVGRLAPEKGVHTLIEAFVRIADRHPGARLDLVGPDDLSPKQFVDPLDQDPLLRPVAHFYGSRGAFRRHLDQLAGPLGARVALHGPVANDRLGGLLGEAGIFAFPSLWQEPFGIPPVEAMAAGLPVVATRAGALPEIVVPERTGLLVERGDVEGLARALDRLLADPGLRARLGAAGRERARASFSWDGQVALLERLYAAHGDGA
jgi:glycosyltransferase involved in cell wall biosynthesis